uniref:ribosomal protein L20 n=1 Tax=Hypnea nidifica TaxID=673448 RepID=UPI003003A465|nr:ribosomal protein L20 [Hypnea nidifica]
MLQNKTYKNKTLQSKEKFLNNLFLKRLNFNTLMKYNLFYFFMQREKVILNKKILWLLYSTEKGSIFSLRKLLKFLVFKHY